MKFPHMCLSRPQQGCEQKSVTTMRRAAGPAGHDKAGLLLWQGREEEAYWQVQEPERQQQELPAGAQVLYRMYP